MWSGFASSERKRPEWRDGPWHSCAGSGRMVDTRDLSIEASSEHAARVGALLLLESSWAGTRVTERVCSD
jgi:hypothetical protein